MSSKERVVAVIESNRHHSMYVSKGAQRLIGASSTSASKSKLAIDILDLST